MKRVVLKLGRDKSLRRRHPWVFSGAVARVDGGPQPGETVEVVAADGAFLGRGAYSPRSQIRVRILSFDPAVAVDEALIASRLQHALAYRARQFPVRPDGLRLVHGEADGLPGVVVDRYGEFAVLQCTATSAERWREVIAAGLIAHGGCRGVYERSDAEVRELEGLPARCGVVRGAEPPPSIEITEGAARYRVDVRGGHKTGFYLDQRDNRARLATLAAGREVLDVFAYTGGFTCAALAGGAAGVTAIDSSHEALARARDNVAASGFAPGAVEWLEGDAFALLRELHAQGRRFDVVVLDPPKFAPTAKHVQRAARAYKDVNLWALRLLREGGTLLSFSCSAAVDPALLQSIVAGAALDAPCAGRIGAWLHAAADHPVALNFPEAAYLKGLQLERG
ncbi:MAG: class I SAM-dependent rRNA methyltransferase [Gammaproteobacteria bacterium]|nr:class I SAM-dependent rRNA methyltransferase [Gammaproteobacteria bacterium]MCP5200063.1 class I SAM-dependent rRNA methyltransferase [Gammaproteobacteria bacterium]